ncbi:MAG: aldehyde dehydrogenase family protein [Pseudomonadota bacterium]
MADGARLDRDWPNYVDGEWVTGGAGWLDVEDPATGAVIARQALADATDVDRAVRAAARLRDAGTLRDMRPVERGRMVQALGRYLTEHSAEIAEVLTREQGKPLWESLIEIDGAAAYFEYYGGQAATVEGRSVPLGAGYYDWTECEPLGVSAQIIPWNYPIEMAARSLAPALATGNACVVKTPELTPISSAWLVHAAEGVGWPAGAVNVLCGIGAEAGAALSAHPQVDQIVFTGSVPTGIAIATAAARNVVPCVLELGGKSAAIVHDDADLEAFESDIRWGIYFNAGQVCSAMSRVIVHESRADEVIARASSVARGLTVGPGIDAPEFGPTMGAMVSLPQRDRARAMVGRAVEAGGRIVVGGHAPNGPGAFFAPTVLADIRPDMEIAREEVFGPVLSILTFRAEAEAIAIANGTEYGLVAGVFTRDLDRATRAARALRAGQVFVNEWYAGGVETPFGGVGKSGYGREKGREALWNYVRTKNIAVRLGARL